MANYTTMSEESIRYLCGLINKIVSLPTDIISNINLADNLTFSNIYIKNLIDKCLQDANAEAEKLVGALTHLTCKETTVQPTLDNSEINVIYLYSADGNPPYQQFLKISDTKLVDLGSTSINLTDYLTITSAASTYAKQTDLKTLSDEVSGIKTKIGSDSLTTTADTLVGAINEVANKSTIVSLTKAEYDALATKDPETYYIITDDEQSVSIVSSINASSTDSEVPTAKAINVECKYGRIINNDVIATYGTEISKYPVGKWVIYRNDMAVQFTDLPTKAACRINIYGLLDNNFTPFNNSWQYRMINVIDISGKLYTREFNSGNTAGVFEYDSGWQRVCTTKVDNGQVLLWEGDVVSETTVTFNEPISNYPNAKRLILVLWYSAHNETVFLEIPKFLWDWNTNLGISSKVNDKEITINLIPYLDLTDTTIKISISNSLFTFKQVYLEE